MDGKVIDAATRARLLERFGPRAIGWCEGLPARLDRLARNWGLRVVRPVSNGNTACVFVCERTGGKADDVVLKLSPDRSLVKDEASALAAWRASGRVPRVLGFDGESGALLMELIRPGTMLGDGPAAAARLAEVAGLVRELHADGEAGAGFPPLAGLVEFFFAFWGEQLRKPQAASVVPRELFEVSLATARELSARPGRRVLLHGDLHPRNVLDGGPERGLVAIDPRACVGDPAFDLIDWVFRGGDDDDGGLARRAGWLAEEAGVDAESLRRWCGCTAVLEAIRRLVREGDSPDAVHPLLAFARNRA